MDFEHNGLDLLGDNQANLLDGGADNDLIRGRKGADELYGNDGDDKLQGGRGADLLDGGEGNDILLGGRGSDYLFGDAGDDLLRGGRGSDELEGGDGNDILRGGRGEDLLEGGLGDDMLFGGKGDDTLLAFSWGGEPGPAQDADGQINDDEPLSDLDALTGGKGADTFEFRWLLDATDEIYAKHTDPDTGDIDYRAIAGENDNVHDHWVETIDTKIVTDFDADEGDVLIFEGHTVALAEVVHEDVDDNGELDTVLIFVSDQGGNGGAHDQDEIGEVVILDNQLDADDIEINTDVFYGVYEPWSIEG